MPLFRLCLARKCNLPAWIQFTFKSFFPTLQKWAQTALSLSKFFPRLLDDFHVNTCNCDFKFVNRRDTASDTWYFWVLSSPCFRLSYEARLSFRAWTWMAPARNFVKKYFLTLPAFFFNKQQTTTTNTDAVSTREWCVRCAVCVTTLDSCR